MEAEGPTPGPESPNPVKDVWSRADGEKAESRKGDSALARTLRLKDGLLEGRRMLETVIALPGLLKDPELMGSFNAAKAALRRLQEAPDDEEAAKLAEEALRRVAAHEGLREAEEGLKCPSCGGTGTAEEDGAGALGYLVRRDCPDCKGKPVP